MSGFWKFLVGGIVGGLVGFLVSPKRAREVMDGLRAGDRERRVRVGAPDHPRLAPAPPPARPEPQASPPPPPGGVSETPNELAGAGGAPSIPEELVPEDIEPPFAETEEVPAVAEELPVEIEAAVEAAEPQPAEPQPAVVAPTDALEARIAETKRRLREVQEAMLVDRRPFEAQPDVVVPVAEGEAAAEAEEPVAQAKGVAEAKGLELQVERQEPEDLRARIEETRRRIKEELEHSFTAEPSPAPSRGVLPGIDREPGGVEAEAPVLGEEAEPPTASEGYETPDEVGASVEEVFDLSEVVDVSAEEVDVLPEEVDVLPEEVDAPTAPGLVSESVEEAHSDSAVEAAFESAFRHPVGEEIEQATASSAEPGTGFAEEGSLPEGGPTSFDYETMRRRIEETRSRLKSKAFDAMMSGETALLEKSAEGAATLPATTPLIDEEVDETVESTLTEEEY